MFDRFIQTLCSTHSAVSIDTDAQQKFQFKLYLVTALVPFTTLSRNLGYKQDDPDFTVGTTEEICHKKLIYERQAILCTVFRSKRCCVGQNIESVCKGKNRKY